MCQSTARHPVLRIFLEVNTVQVTCAGAGMTSVASRRVAAPYGVDDLTFRKVNSKQKRSNFKRATRADVTTAFVELATLAEPADDGHLSTCKFCNPE